MKIAVISGSSRPDSQSLKISHWLTNKIEAEHPEISLHPFSLEALNITMDPDEYWAGKSEKAKLMKRVYGRFEEVDGFIMVSPEWGGGVPPALRQLILMSGTSMSHKPVLVVGVSATKVGGIRPIEELKHASKNTRFVLVPDPVVIPEVESVFNKPEVDKGNEHEAYTAGKIDYSLKILNEYAKALKLVRDSGVVNYEDFPFGM